MKDSKGLLSFFFNVSKEANLIADIFEKQALEEDFTMTKILPGSSYFQYFYYD